MPDTEVSGTLISKPASTPTARVIDHQGAPAGTVELPAAVFGAPVNGAAMHQALIRQLANARQGTSDTRNRTEVRGGGRKPYRQKGTGRARQGSIRAPHYRGGGVVFGPHPRSYRQDMPRKQRRLALRGALTVKARDQQLTVVRGFAPEHPRTRAVVDLLRAAEAGRRVLFVLGSHDDVVEKSARNLPEVQVVLASNLSIHALLTADTVLMTEDALGHVAEAWS